MSSPLARRAVAACALSLALVCLGTWCATAFAVSPPTITTSFGASSLAVSGSTSLSFTIINPNPATGLLGVNFNDDLPPGLVVATPSGLSSDCSSPPTASAGSTNVSMSGTALAPHDGCTIDLNVRATANGKKENPVTVQSNSGTGNTSTAILQVGSSFVPGDRLYWSNLNYGLAFANLNGTSAGDLDTAGPDSYSEQSLGIALDPALGRVYWASFLNSKILYANLDGSGDAHELNTGSATVNEPTGVSIDPTTGRIYWTNQGSSPYKISYANLDGTGNGHDLNTMGANVTDPQGVAVDPASGRLYWTNNGGNPLSSAKLDGSGGGHDYVTTGALGGGHGLAVDSAHGLVYLPGVGTIGFDRLDDSGGGGLGVAGADVNSAIGVAMDPAANRIYWANSGISNPGAQGANTLAYANLNGTGDGHDLTTTGASVNQPFYAALLEAPAGTGGPAVSGGSTPGSALSCSPATWAPDDPAFFLYRAPQSFALQWRLNGADIPGATSTTYTAPSPGSYTCVAIASNVAGSTQQTSAPFVIPTGQRAAALKKCKKKHHRARKRCRKKAMNLPV
jgi:low-density lipoprotein receptor class B